MSVRPPAAALGFAVSFAFLSASACALPDEPPGRSIESAESPSLPPPPVPDEIDASALDRDGDARLPEEIEPGKGHKLASIAMRNFVYISPDYQSTRLGYLRAGAVVERGAAPAGYQRCKGGW